MAGLRDGRHEVLRAAERHLPEQAGFVRSHRVEVAERDERRPADLRDVLQHLLAHLLGPGVRGFRLLERGVLGDREFRDVAVDRAGRGEHDVRDAVLLHGAEDVDERSDVVLEIEQRLANRLRNRLERREMDDRVDRSRRGEHIVSRREIAEIDVVVGDVPSGDRANAVDRRGVRADAIVDR